MARQGIVSVVLALGAVMAFAAIPASAQDIRIDLSNLVSTTAGNWNNVGSLNTTTSGLIDYTSGTSTGVSITGSGWQDFVGDAGGTFPNQDWLVQPATADGAGIQAFQAGAFTFSGLTGSSYRIEVVSARTQFNYLNTFLVGGSSANRTYLGTAVNTPWGSTSDGLTPGNWLIWDNVAPVSGSITLTDSVQDTLGMVNAVRILGPSSPVVPEPGPLAVAAGMILSTAGFVIRRRRA